MPRTKEQPATIETRMADLGISAESLRDQLVHRLPIGQVPSRATFGRLIAAGRQGQDIAAHKAGNVVLAAFIADVLDLPLATVSPTAEAMRNDVVVLLRTPPGTPDDLPDRRTGCNAVTDLAEAREGRGLSRPRSRQDIAA
jgi:hypothetical protein